MLSCRPPKRLRIDATFPSQKEFPQAGLSYVSFNYLFSLIPLPIAGAQHRLTSLLFARLPYSSALERHCRTICSRIRRGNLAITRPVPTASLPVQPWVR